MKGLPVFTRRLCPLRFQGGNSFLIFGFLSDFGNLFGIDYLALFIHYYDSSGMQTCQRSIDNTNPVGIAEAKIPIFGTCNNIVDSFSNAKTFMSEREIPRDAQNYGIFQFCRCRVQNFATCRTGCVKRSFNDVI